MVVIAVGVSFDEALSSSVPGHSIFEGSWVVVFEGVSEAPLDKRAGSVPVNPEPAHLDQNICGNLKNARPKGLDGQPTQTGSRS